MPQRARIAGKKVGERVKDTSQHRHARGWKEERRSERKRERREAGPGHDTGRVVTTVFQPLQALEKRVDHIAMRLGRVVIEVGKDA